MKNTEQTNVVVAPGEDKATTTACINVTYPEASNVANSRINIVSATTIRAYASKSVCSLLQLRSFLVSHFSIFLIPVYF